jgi:mono/diheme cytochrome c family protein
MSLPKALIVLLSLSSIGGMNGCSQGESKSGRLYSAHCGNCHGIDGEGLERLIPPLAGSDFLQENKDRLACIIRYGLRGEITVNGEIYHHPMPGNEQLSEVDITNIINYINQSWSQREEFVSPVEIKRQLQECRE